MDRLVPFAAALVLAPLLIGVVNRVKAFFAGRRGPSLLQPYLDLSKLLRKGAVYSRTSTWLIVAGPCVSLAAILVALLLAPLGPFPALVSFPGDFVALACLLGIARLFTALAALDTGSSFEGMGASREVFFSALVEPAFFLSLAVLVRARGELSLSAILSSHDWSHIMAAPPLVLLPAAALFIVFLAENARVPVDDPNTHLELTMIHEVMVLDHGGPDLAFIEYAAALKFWILGAILGGLLLPVRSGLPALDILCAVAGPFAVAVVVGVIESSMARLRLIRIQQFLVAASVLAVIALGLLVR